MSAGSDFALRIALADLVARLKRSEEMCKYLERCRNEMAKELIRVKQENQIISRENSMLAASLENSFGVPMAPRMKSPRSPVPTSANENEPPVTGQDEVLDKSTDWEEITARLLNQLRKEVELMAPKGTTVVSPFILPEEDQRNKSVGSMFVLPADSSAVPRGKHCASVKEESTRMMKVLGEEDGMGSGSPSDSKFGAEEKTIEVLPERRPLSTNHSTSPGLEQGGASPKLPLDVMYVKLVQDLTADLNKFADKVVVQNEKLTRIKSKQLRCYFKRQLKPSERKEVRSGGAGESDQYQRRQQHPKPGLAELI